MQEAYRPPRSHSKFLLFRGGGPSTKNIFASLNMYQAKSGVKNFSLYWGGVSLDKNFFSPVWTCIKPNLVSKNFPFTGGGGVPQHKIFSLVWTCIKPNLVSKILPFTGGGVTRQRFFFPVWTCIKPNLVSKNFPFTETGHPVDLRLGTPTLTWTWNPPTWTWDSPTWT